MGEISFVGIAFYIVPLINAMIRVGTQEQKDLMFRAFCNEYAEFDYTKRDKTVIKENIFDRVARECVNAKSRQDRLKINTGEKVAEHIEKNGLHKNKIILACVDDIATQELTGLIAMNIAEKYKRPALLYRTRDDEYHGSARNYDGFELRNLKDFLESTELFTLTQGHQSAFGIAFNKNNERKIIKACNKEFSNYNIDYTHNVDFIVPFEDLDDSIFYEVDKAKALWGQCVSEPFFAIIDVDILLNQVKISTGKTGNTIKFEVDGITFIRFRANEDDELLRICQDWELEENSAKLNIVGKVGISSFGGIKTKQIIVNDWEILK
jgi:single-stranded-DNA-specific exonuclease